MANAKILKKYLVNKDNGYLLDDNNNGKVIMLSGKWGSGKTHFWKNDIATDEFKQKLTSKESAYSYVSLYGKSSIEEIENDIFAQLYFSAIGGENIVTQKVSTFTKYTKRYGSIFSEKIEKFANGVKEEQKDNQERIALERLKNGAIICFDDFERKSKEIDLNDLFGFITQLTLNFDCKVVIILNDDVFEGEEKKIFSNVKEKSVSKFLKYEPSIKELFETIFSDERYRVLDEHKDIILKTIEETEELNARIYIQVLDNLVEWIEKTKITNENFIKYFIFVNINFILNHYIFKLKWVKNTNTKLKYIDIYLMEEDKMLKGLIEYVKGKNANSVEELKVIILNTFIGDIDKSKLLEYIDKNEALIRSLLYHDKLIINGLMESNNQSEYETFQKINNFIETGILINE